LEGVAQTQHAFRAPCDGFSVDSSLLQERNTGTVLKRGRWAS
jgi:hypothetical protein